MADIVRLPVSAMDKRISLAIMIMCGKTLFRDSDFEHSFRRSYFFAINSKNDGQTGRL